MTLDQSADQLFKPADQYKIGQGTDLSLITEMQDLLTCARDLIKTENIQRAGLARTLAYLPRKLPDGDLTPIGKLTMVHHRRSTCAYGQPQQTIALVGRTPLQITFGCPDPDIVALDVPSITVPNAQREPILKQAVSHTLRLIKALQSHLDHLVRFTATHGLIHHDPITGSFAAHEHHTMAVLAGALSQGNPNLATLPTPWKPMTLSGADPDTRKPVHFTSPEVTDLIPTQLTLVVTPDDGTNFQRVMLNPVKVILPEMSAVERLRIIREIGV